ncbi:ferric reductase-like transmembrane domain-containing protein [Neptunomonas sp.]|uniref:ferredoxin reductase family protein n=1 Tax=Neptunomonas sp. TaxID=1971898 RepID=UPI003563A2A5
MKPIKLTLLASLLLLTGLWMMADTFFPQPLTYFSFRAVFVQYSGVLAVGVMSIAMLLALRPVILEPYLNGLDKMYRLHKWLGISALLFAVLHWWFAKGTKWMVGWGWLSKPDRGRRPQETLSWLETTLRSLRGLAESVGEWTFYAAALLILLALIKWVPYRFFQKTHKLMAPVYLLLVCHSVVLMDFAYWMQPVGIVLGLFMLVGCYAAALALFNQVGVSRKVRGAVASIEYYPELQVLETAINLEKGWSGHKAGQFAFVSSKRHEGAHPYTIASAWDSVNQQIVFITKELGDHTKTLREYLKVGTPVTVEGPYGCFDFSDAQPRQIWIGAGIGITPFVARMKQLAVTPGKQHVDLFHPTAELSDKAITKLKADAKAAGVNLHILVSAKDGRLNGQRIRESVPEWQYASVWFCGPSAFGQSLRQDLIANGMAEERFHQELFEMR